MMIGGAEKFTAAEKQKIARYNDNLRKHGVGGIIILEDYLLLKPLRFQRRVMEAIREDDHGFTKLDPFHQHGLVNVADTQVHWNISAVNRVDLSRSNVDPTDPIGSFREMTVGVAEAGENTDRYGAKCIRFAIEKSRTTNQLKIHVSDLLDQLKNDLGLEEYEQVRRSISEVLRRDRRS